VRERPSFEAGLAENWKNGSKGIIVDVTQPEWLDHIKGVLENLNQGVIINDSRNRILFANSIFLRMIGLTAEQLLRRTVTELFPPEDIELLLIHIERRQTEGHGLYEFYLPQPGGRRLPVLVTSRQINENDGEVFAVVTATDISAQKRAEAELRQANEQLEKRHRVEAELLLAARVQQSLAPSSLTCGRVSVETFYEPARTIGGDFGLVAPSADSIFVMVSDISGMASAPPSLPIAFIQRPCR
jgi:PAS domain S-box-containing protein